MISETLESVGRRIKSLIFKVRLMKLHIGLLYKNYLLNSNIQFKLGKKIKLEKNVKFLLGKKSKIQIGDGTNIETGSRIECAKNASLVIGKNVLFTGYDFIVSRGSINIGDNTIIAEFVSIRDADHKYNDISKSIRFTLGYDNEYDIRPIFISNDVWISAHVTILKGVKIGEHSVIGANAVITKDIPPYSVAVGVPAKVIKKYDFEKQKWEKIKDE